ncbi:50S ribosomal protein L18 [Desulfoplanes formicivorans]|uniref:Large ribosomal subunit protein uL18 n=1 Tax=Desulfoplanes formicivorans TaxID=1592317 RepID=A0A194ADW5_9BACT|nr:50S ribosomal protein L18 [Desulfoplanes formicivorans]GAU07528.1 50S ribosomal protein L18 [Desulfoplanes formicivorans]
MKSSKRQARLKRKIRIRKKIFGTAERPRLVVFRSNKHIYAQLINDDAGTTLVSSSSLAMDEFKNGSANIETAKVIGKRIAEEALKQDISAVVFDRNGYVFHGKVKAFADSAREAGLKF